MKQIYLLAFALFFFTPFIGGQMSEVGDQNPIAIGSEVRDQKSEPGSYQVGSEMADSRENDPTSTVDHPPSTVNLDSSRQIADYVVEVFQDKKGNLWFGTMNKGAARYGTSLTEGGQKLTYFSTKDGLCDNTVVSIAQDKKGNMWFGTHAGASKYDGKIFTNFTDAQGLHGAGCKILVDKEGNIWAGTNHGAFRFDGSKFSEFKLPKPIVGIPSYKWELGKIWCLMEDKKGNIWFGRDGYGACKYDGKKFSHFLKIDGLCSNNVASIVEDKKGNIWFGSLTSDHPEPNKDGGLCKYNGDSLIRYPDIKGLHDNDIYTIYADKSGNVWIGATGYGVYKYDGKNFTLFKMTDRQDLTVNFGVQSILEDSQQRLWFGFSGGLFRFNGNTFMNVTQDGPWRY